jgi:hypothetical protein
MKALAFLVVLLYCGLARAEFPGCDVHAMDGQMLDEVLTFEDLLYIITEENDPRFVPLGTAITYTTKRYNHCKISCWDLAWHNAEVMAAEKLWDKVTLTTGEIVGWGCGGEVECKEPVHAHNVQCTVEIGDCELDGLVEGSPYFFFKIKETKYLECLGDLSCKYEGRPITDCCIIVSIES